MTAKLDPNACIQVILAGARPDRSGPQRIVLDADLPADGDQGPTPYELLLGAVIAGDRSRFVRQDNVDECWRIVQPLLDSPPPARIYEPGSWGPAEADELAAPYGAGGVRTSRGRAADKAVRRSPVPKLTEITLDWAREAVQRPPVPKLIALRLDWA